MKTGVKIAVLFCVLYWAVAVVRADPATAQITLPSVPGWATPTTVNLVVNDAGSATFSGSNGKFEDGIPLFSWEVEPGAIFYPCTVTNGFPQRLNSYAINRKGGSSFIAVKTETNGTCKVWINASVGAWNTDGYFIADWEYQIRYFSGDPDKNIPPSMLMGTVGNSLYFVTNNVVDGYEVKLASVEVGLQKIDHSALIFSAQDDPDSPLDVNASTYPIWELQPRLDNLMDGKDYGLVADGVTPLMLRFELPVAPSLETQFKIDFQVTGGTVDLKNKLRIFSGSKNSQSVGFTAAGSSDTIHFWPNERINYAYLTGINAEDIQFDKDSKEVTVTVIVEGPGCISGGLLQFKIRRPPLLLAHGYNANAGTWSQDFLDQLALSRPTDFIFPINYGTTIAPDGKTNNYANTYLRLDFLAQLLDNVIQSTIEDSRTSLQKHWAFTRFDVAGHSQGGVLLRMLTAAPLSFVHRPYMGVDNCYRGRFRRIITIGSPHNGAALLYYALQMTRPTVVNFFLPRDVRNLIQKKFAPWGDPDEDPNEYQIGEINNPAHAPHQAAKFHLIEAKITDVCPLLFAFTGLCAPLINQPITNQILARYNVIFPGGSDAIVEHLSQCGGHPTENSTSLVDVSPWGLSHSDIPLLLGPPSHGYSETSHPNVAMELNRLFDGPSNGFSQFYLPQQASAAQKSEIDSFIPTITVKGIITGVLGTPLPQAKLITHKELSISSVYNLSLAADSNAVRSVQWFAQVFGTNGITDNISSDNGVTVTGDSSDTRYATVVVSSNVVGDIVVYGSYIDANGDIVVGKPVLLESHPPGNLIGVNLVLPTDQMQIGASVAPEIWGVYDSGLTCQLYIAPEEPVLFTSSDPSVLTVNPTNGEAVAISAGLAMVGIQCRGFTNSAGLDVLPEGDLSVELIASTNAMTFGGIQDSNLAYVATVANNSQSPVKQVRLQDVLPIGVSLVACSTSQGTFTNADQVIDCDLGTLPGGGLATVSIVVKPLAAGDLCDVASVSGQGHDPVPSNNFARVCTKIQQHTADYLNYWQEYPRPAYRINHMIFSQGSFIGVGDRGMVVNSTADGSQWFPTTLPSFEDLHKVLWDGTQYYLLGTTNLYTSRDRVNWEKIGAALLPDTRPTVAGSTKSPLWITDLDYGNGKFYAVDGMDPVFGAYGDTFDLHVYSSTNCLNWSPVYTNNWDWPRRVIISGPQLVTAGQGDKIQDGYWYGSHEMLEVNSAANPTNPSTGYEIPTVLQALTELKAFGTGFAYAGPISGTWTPETGLCGNAVFSEFPSTTISVANNYSILGSFLGSDLTVLTDPGSIIKKTIFPNSGTSYQGGSETLLASNLPSANASAQGNGIYALGNGATSTNLTNWMIPARADAQTQADSVAFGNSNDFGADSPADIAYGNGRYVAITQQGKILAGSETNRFSFVTDLHPGTNQPTLTAITYGTNGFVTVGESGWGAYSSNGLDWTQFTLQGPIAGGLLYANGSYFIASADGNYIYWSTNGTNWLMAPPIPETTNDIVSFPSCYGRGKFWGTGSRRVFDSGLGYDQYIPAVYSSDDGIHWSLYYADPALATTDGSFQFYQILVDDAAFFINGNYAFYSYKAGFTYLDFTMVSVDGLNWIRKNFPTADDSEFGIYDMMHYGDVFTINGPRGMWTSFDGITWSHRNAPVGDGLKVLNDCYWTIGNGLHQSDPMTPAPPNIVDQPVGGVMVTNSATSLFVATTGSSPLTYQWKRNGRDITNAHGAVLTLSPLTVQDSGSYAVEVRNPYGSITSSNALLQVVVPDKQNPTVTILSPKASQTWTNQPCEINGTANDNQAVANVKYQVNYGPWTLATTTNGWMNWSAIESLAPGTNVLSAYATDFFGNRSPTNSVTMKCVLADRLHLSMTGAGTVVPNYSNAFLQIGSSFAMTAKPAAGFGFLSWKDGVGNIVTNSPTLKFAMASNLAFTANFADVAKPTLTIVSPKANQRWSNAVLTINGKASDNAAVANVLYSANNSSWLSAAVSGSNWTAPAMLIPGLNSLSAYAVDTSGNRSATNTVKVFYVVLDALTVRTNGKGTLSPAYNGARLQIGSSYAMTAKPAAGFGFRNWTDGADQILTNGPTLKFAMASNLVFWANFMDIAKPTLSILSPKANERVSNAVLTITGKATDNGTVGSVFYSVNNAPWLAATTANNWSNWTAQAVLMPGTNHVSAYAEDVAGNTSVTNSVVCISLPLAGQTATAIPQLRIENWSGNLMSTNAWLQLKLTGGGSPVILDRSLDLIRWTPVQTNVVPAEGISLLIPVGQNPTQFFRLRTQP